MPELRAVRYPKTPTAGQERTPEGLHYVDAILSYEITGSLLHETGVGKGEIETWAHESCTCHVHIMARSLAVAPPAAINDQRHKSSHTLRTRQTMSHGCRK